MHNGIPNEVYLIVIKQLSIERSAFGVHMEQHHDRPEDVLRFFWIFFQRISPNKIVQSAENVAFLKLEKGRPVSIVEVIECIQARLLKPVAVWVMLFGHLKADADQSQILVESLPEVPPL
jgi:hypothetical protein